MTARAQSISGLRSDGYSSDSTAYIGSYPDGYQPTSGLTLTTTSSRSLLKDRDSPAITARAQPISGLHLDGYLSKSKTLYQVLP